jgi:hypothetical protein
VSADDLQSAYAMNEVSADAEYRGKRLQVTGAVKDIMKVLDRPFLVLWTRNEFVGVHANFDRDKEQSLAGIHPGDHVIVLCTGDGAGLGESPMLDGCTLE